MTTQGARTLAIVTAVILLAAIWWGKNRSSLTGAPKRAVSVMILCGALHILAAWAPTIATYGCLLLIADVMVLSKYGVGLTTALANISSDPAAVNVTQQQPESANAAGASGGNQPSTSVNAAAGSGG